MRIFCYIEMLCQLKADEDQAINVPLPEKDDDDGNEDPLEHENERLRDENRVRRNIAYL